MIVTFKILHPFRWQVPTYLWYVTTTWNSQNSTVVCHYLITINVMYLLVVCTSPCQAYPQAWRPTEESGPSQRAAAGCSGEPIKFQASNHMIFRWCLAQVHHHGTFSIRSSRRRESSGAVERLDGPTQSRVDSEPMIQGGARLRDGSQNPNG
jgi:hypothetical protein